MILLIDTPSNSHSVNEVVSLKTLITEATDNKDKKYYVEGVFAQAEVKNRNGRIYPKKCLENAVTAFSPLINAKRALGELNHPNSPQVNPERASHLIEKLTWDGNNVIGRAKILTTLPMGKICKGLIDEGVSFGVSTRGLGTIHEKSDVKMVGDDYIMSTIDIVGDPSAPDAFVSAILENQSWLYDSSRNSWILAETIKKTIQKTPAKRVNEDKLRLFETFLNSIK